MLYNIALHLTILLVLSYQQGLAEGYGANNWTHPCVDGHCSWDLPPESGSSGTLHIVRSSLSLTRISHADSRTQWGSTSAISDITPAAGWQITGCAPDARAPDIELTCLDFGSHCDHIFQGGVVHTVVRLPESVSFLLILAFPSVRTHPDCGTTFLAVRSDAFCARSEPLDQGWI